MFDWVGHETTYASSWNKHFFTKKNHRQTYQNYEQPPRISQSRVLVLKIGQIFPKKSLKNIWLNRRPTFTYKRFWNLSFFRYLCTLFSKNESNFCQSDGDSISTRCIHGFMSNKVKKSWTVSILETAEGLKILEGQAATEGLLSNFASLVPPFLGFLIVVSP